MIGIDLVKIVRIEGMIRRFGERGLRRFLHESELAIAKNPQSIAGFWAAKEAIAKALHCGIGKELSFKDIEIYKERNGAPSFRLLHGKMEYFQVKECALSISHDGEYAIAVAQISRRR